MRLVVEHLRGVRRNERDVFDHPERVSFGRHPQNDVVFDAREDIDASSRHAELWREGSSYVLRDVGSSNGTFVDGEQIHELVLQPGRAIHIDLGAGGPRVRLWIGEFAGAAPAGGPITAPPPPPRRAGALAVVAIAAAIGLTLWIVF